ncbi:hypothetical protein [Pseudobacteriovorax antillogorgiicola]|uniref:Uncharacterized protein n=1 Tax=Pseudobacteriovorax antillogorgiicola TaxID=1513793 RepID=A0A1Y6BG41_9BACT|nr:hypothetical protein [Pseudobacteriovorax antillogorgiicola]TCS56242.1 hypothetical protein EDD56_10464 [Pseudobacteriovorax antillogorgiicola]SMF08115.1 hypothetical protein SAMN06296036_104269 [Pseudobacteriovorax antillogorgiicola]
MFRIILADDTAFNKTFKSFQDAEFYRSYQIKDLFTRKLIFEDRKDYYNFRLKDWMLSRIEGESSH